MKNVLLIFLISIAILSAISAVSAGIFDSGQTHNEKIATELTCSVLMGNDSVQFKIYFNDSNSNLQSLGGTVYYNLTDDDGNVKSYNETLSALDGAVVHNLPSGHYIITAYYPGDEEYGPSSTNATIDVPAHEGGIERVTADHHVA